MKKLLSLFFIFFVLLVGDAFADSNRSRYKVPVTGLSNFNTYLSEGFYPLTKNDKKPNFEVTTSIPGVGLVRFRINKRHFYDVVATISNGYSEASLTDNVVLLRGKLKAKNQADVVAADVMEEEGKIVLSIHFFANNGRGGKNNLYLLKVPLNSKEGTLKRSSYRAPAFCKNELELMSDKIEYATSRVTSQSVKRKQLTLFIHANREWYDIFGKNSSAKIKSYINTAEAIYEKQFNIVFKINFIRILTEKVDLLSETYPEILLNNYREYAIGQDESNSANVNALFTGNMMDENTLGIARTGSICFEFYDMEFLAVSGSLKEEVRTPIVFAHELGHILGAKHDENSFGIMNPSISVTNLPTSFSSFSVNQITNNINNNGSCIVEVNVDPKLEDVNVSCKVTLTKKGQFNAKVVINNEQNLCQTQLIFNKDKNSLKKSKSNIVFDPTSLTTSINASMPFKLINIKNGKNVFFYAAVTCPDGRSGESGISSVKISKVRGTKQIKTPQAWIKKFKKQAKVIAVK